MAGKNKTVAAVESGITEEYYASKIPLMYLINGQHFFFNFLCCHSLRQ